MRTGAVASQGDRASPQGFERYPRPVWSYRRYHCGLISGPSGIDCAGSATCTCAHPIAYRYRFRVIRRRDPDKSRQQFPGAAWKL